MHSVHDHCLFRFHFSCTSIRTRINRVMADDISSDEREEIVELASDNDDDSPLETKVIEDEMVSSTAGSTSVGTGSEKSGQDPKENGEVEESEEEEDGEDEDDESEDESDEESSSGESGSEDSEEFERYMCSRVLLFFEF